MYARNQFLWSFYDQVQERMYQLIRESFDANLFVITDVEQDVELYTQWNVMNEYHKWIELALESMELNVFHQYMESGTLLEKFQLLELERIGI